MSARDVLLWALREKSLVAARGSRYLESIADPYGDAAAAIWIHRRLSDDGTSA